MKRALVYLPESELAEKHQNGDFTWVDYIAHHSDEWCDEYEAFCRENNFDENDDTAAQLFVEHKDEQLEMAIAAGEA